MPPEIQIHRPLTLPYRGRQQLTEREIIAVRLTATFARALTLRLRRSAIVLRTFGFEIMRAAFVLIILLGATEAALASDTGPILILNSGLRPAIRDQHG